MLLLIIIIFCNYIFIYLTFDEFINISLYIYTPAIFIIIIINVIFIFQLCILFYSTFHDFTNKQMAKQLNYINTLNTQATNIMSIYNVTKCIQS